MKDDFLSIIDGIKLVIKDKRCWVIVALLSFLEAMLGLTKSIPILYIIFSIFSIFFLVLLNNNYNLQIYSLLSDQSVQLKEMIRISSKKVCRVVLVVFIEVIMFTPFLCITSLISGFSALKVNSNPWGSFFMIAILYIFLPFFMFSTYEALLFDDSIGKVIRSAFSLYSHFLFKFDFIALIIWFSYWILSLIFYGFGLLAFHNFQPSVLNQINLMFPWNTNINVIMNIILQTLVSIIYIVVFIPIFIVLYKKYSGKQYFHVQKT